MNKKELIRKLNILGIPEDYYNLYGKNNAETTILAKKKDKWLIYGIDERGGYHEYGIFDTESDACDFLYQRMVEFKWVMEHAHIHPDNKPKPEDRIGYEVTEDGKVKAILTDGRYWPE